MAVFRQPQDDNVPWDQRLANYATNKDAGKSEYQRAMEVYRGKSAIGDTAGAAGAQKWAGQVNTAIGGIGDNRVAQVNDTLDTIGQKVNAAPFEFKQTQGPFQYNNPESDPLYQAAMRQAQQGAQTATNNAMVGLGSRGIGNSSVAVDRANQIQQKAIGNVNDTVLPQLMAQAYGRYQDSVNNDYRNQMANYGAGQDQVKNLTGYVGTLNGLNQQEADNTYRNNVFGEQQKQNNVDLAKWGTSTYGFGAPKSDAGTFFNQYQGAKTLPVQQFEYGQGQDRIQNGISQQNANTSAASVANSNQNAKDRLAFDKEQSSTNSNQSALYKQWEATGVAPAGIPGVAQGTPLYDKTGARQDQQAQNKQEQLDAKSFGSERDGMIAAIRSNKVNVNDAMTQINQDEKMGIYTPDLAEKLRSVVRVLAGQTKITNDPQNNIQVDLSGYGGGKGSASTVTGNVFGN